MNRLATSTGRGNSSSFPHVTTTPSVLVQRSCACGESASLGAKCEACANRKLQLQRSAETDRSGAPGASPASPVPSVPAIVHDVLRSPGQPLDRAVRAGMETGFGHDFSRVRVHTDRAAAESARAVNARAFTVGEQIVFAEHQYAAGSESGKRLLAHELVHTIQQRGGVNHGVLAVSSPTDSLEREADAAATAVLDQRDATVIDQHHAAAIDQHHPIAQVVTATAPALLARAPDDPQPTTNPPAPTPTPSGDAGTGTSSSAAPGNVTPAEPTATPDAGQKPPAPPKKVCLTFDDGPQDPGTMDVLNGLGSSIKATFFLQGSKMVPTERLMQPNDPMLPAATKQAELVAQILAKGHQIANHTFWHVPFKKTQYDALTQKPQAEQDKTITEGFTKNLAYFQRLYEDHKEAFAARGITSFPGFQLGRLPGQGKDYPPYVALVEGLGLKHVAWNAEFAPKGGLGAPLGTADWKGVQGLDSEIKGNGCTGNNWILLLHDPLWDGKQALLQSLIEKLRTGCNAEFGVLNASGACS